MSKKRIARDIRRVATPSTLQYIQSLIAYKKTHISRETERLSHLEKMESELLAIIK